MRRTTASIATLGVAAALSLSACGSNSSSTPSSTGSSSGTTLTAACSLDNPPKSAASIPKTVDLGKASGKVGVILPDTTSSDALHAYDQPLLQKALSAAGITPDIQNAQGDKNKFASIAQSMIGEGVKVLIIDSIDAASGAGVEKAADNAGVKVIDYDRVNLGGTAPYYVSFDNEDVGKLQAQTLLDCLKAQGVDDAEDHHDGRRHGRRQQRGAVRQGCPRGPRPAAAASRHRVRAVVKGWDVANAPCPFNQALTAAGGQVDGVLAANDDIANAVIGVLKNNGLNGKVVVTGQDSGTTVWQNIVTGQQSMTIFKDVKLEANAAAQLAIALIQRQGPVSGAA